MDMDVWESKSFIFVSTKRLINMDIHFIFYSNVDVNGCIRIRIGIQKEYLITWIFTTLRCGYHSARVVHAHGG
jgi:hypothetical protein